MDAEPRHRDRLSRSPRCSCGGLPSPPPAIARRDGFAMPVSNPSAPTDEHPKARYPGLGEHPQRNTSLTTWILTFSLDNAAEDHELHRVIGIHKRTVHPAQRLVLYTVQRLLGVARRRTRRCRRHVHVD